MPNPDCPKMIGFVVDGVSLEIPEHFQDEFKLSVNGGELRTYRVINGVVVEILDHQNSGVSVKKLSLLEFTQKYFGDQLPYVNHSAMSDLNNIIERFFGIADAACCEADELRIEMCRCWSHLTDKYRSEFDECLGRIR